MSELATAEDSLPAPFNRKLRGKRASNYKNKKLVVLGERVKEENLFNHALAESRQSLTKSKIEILQVNLGKMCNLKCHHCHVEAGPERTEIMTNDVLSQLVETARTLKISTIDLTGGAPEMSPGFKKYVKEFRALGCEIIVRSNLTILLEPGYEDFTEFFAEHRVQVVASLPCYTAANVDKQRGDGVFDGSICALKKLNSVGYGIPDSGLVLDLVYNPLGPNLPPPEAALEREYKKHLLDDFGVVFNSLVAITNLPIGRFYSDLKKSGQAEAYDNLLIENFNAQTVPKLMCVNTLNVSWDGWLFDCDFNQMIELPLIENGKPLHICDSAAVLEIAGSAVATGNHCFGCTAGAGSSCGGTLV